MTTPSGPDGLGRSDGGAVHEPPPPGARPVVGVVGLGRVGLPTALALLAAGWTVVGCDVSEGRLAAIKARQAGLGPDEQARMDTYLGSDRLTLTTEPALLSSASCVLVCVPTPVDAHLVPDQSALRAACEAVVRHAVPGQTIILSSLSYVGCTRELLADEMEERGLRVGVDVHVAFSAGRVDPVDGARAPQQVVRVVGGMTPESTRRAAEVLHHVCSRPHAVSSPETAELATLLEDSFSAVNIALANEFAGIAQDFDLDPAEVIRAAGTNSSGFMPFYPGPGVGGRRVLAHPYYLLWQLRARHRASPVTEAALTSIVARPRAVLARAKELLDQAARPLVGARVLVVGVAYKPGVADVQGSPAIEIIDELIRSGAQVAFTDPRVERITTAFGELVGESLPVAGAWDLAIVHTLHPGVDYSWLSGTPVVLDTTYRLPAIPQRHLL
jgi:UDP-N-acetyl-D-glucosamine dehydrogenase